MRSYDPDPRNYAMAGNSKALQAALREAQASLSGAGGQGAGAGAGEPISLSFSLDPPPELAYSSVLRHLHGR
eukprot:tig00001214_g7563.t1